MPIYLKDIGSINEPRSLLGIKFKGIPRDDKPSNVNFEVVDITNTAIGQLIRIRTTVVYEMNLSPRGVMALYGDCEVAQEEREYGIDSKPLNLLSALHKFGLLNTGIVRQIGHEFNFDAFEYCHQEGITYNVD